MVDPKLEVKHAGIWSEWYWDTPFGDKAMIMQFFLVTLQWGPARALRYMLQQGPGWGAGVQNFQVDGSWATGGAGTLHSNFSLWSTYQPAPSDPPFSDLYFKHMESTWSLGTLQYTVVPKTHTHAIKQQNKPQNKKVGGHAKSYFYQVEEKQ